MSNYTSTGFLSGFWSREVKMRYNGLLGGGGKYYSSGSKAYGHLKIHSIVQSTISLRSMLMLGGSGGMPPQKNFEK